MGEQLGMDVAITGGTGFIGRRLVSHLLARGDRIKLLTRCPAAILGLPDSVMLFEGDLTSGDVDLRPFVTDVDVLFHCAGEIRDPMRMHAVHVEGTERLIKAASGTIGHWVQLSSTGAYGKVRTGTVTEETASAPDNEYERTKTDSDQLVSAAAGPATFSATLLRPSNVFGPTMTNRSLFQMIAMISKGIYFFIGPSGASANYIYVDNVVDAMLLCATLPQAQGQTFILSDHRPLEEFVAAIADALGRTVPRLRVPEPLARMIARTAGLMPGFPLTSSRVDALTDRVVYSARHINRELNYVHNVSMANGVQKTVQTWRQKP